MAAAMPIGAARQAVEQAVRSGFVRIQGSDNMYEEQTSVADILAIEGCLAVQRLGYSVEDENKFVDDGPIRTRASQGLIKGLYRIVHAAKQEHTNQGSDRLCAILEEQRVILEQLRLPKHTIAVQGWSGQPTVYLCVASYSELLAQVCSVFPSAAAALAAASSASAVAAPPPLLPSNFTLYYIPAGISPDTHLSVWFRVKQKVASEGQLSHYLCSFPSHARNPLLLWQPRAANDAATAAAAGAAVTATPSSAVACSSSVKVPSPSKDEAPVLAALLPSGPPSLGSPSSVKSGSSRSSTDQKPFAEAVYTRDGGRCVVADCGVSPVQAAHIVPVAEARSAESKKAAQLLSLYEPINGISLCVSCHDYLDAGLFHVDPVTRHTLRVSVALSANDPTWAQRDGGAVRMPQGKALLQYWPPKRVLLVQEAFCALKQSERHADVLDKPHACPSCARRFVVNGPAFKQHKKSCEARAMPADYRTPVKQKAGAARKKKG